MSRCALKFAWLVGATWMLAGCSGGKASGSVPPTIAIAAIEQVDGAVDVEPDVEIKITLAGGSLGLGAANLVVTDGGNELPGEWTQVAGSTSWLWTPDAELPRGCQIHTFVDFVEQASFTVRDFALAAEFEVLGESVDLALSWPNGRRAVSTKSGRVFEITTAGLTERFVELPSNARAYGDGDFIAEVDDAGVRYCLRGNLDGTTDRIPTPSGVSLGGNNTNGDVVAFVPDTIGTMADRGLWRLMRSDPAFSIAGPIAPPNVKDVPSIDSNGTVSIAYVQFGSVHVAMYAVGDLTGTHIATPVNWGVWHYSAQFDPTSDGRGVLSWWELEDLGFGSQLVAKGARVSGGLLMPLATEVLDAGVCTGPVSCTQGWFATSIVDVHAGELGSACVMFAHQSWPGPRSAVRIETGGLVSATFPYVTPSTPGTTSSITRVSPLRAELWAMSNVADPNELLLERSRPGTNTTTVIYEASPGTILEDWSFSFDDSGRALIAVTEADGLGLTMRIFLHN